MRSARRDDSPRERERRGADRDVHEEDPAPVDRRKHAADERPDRGTHARRRADDPELRAAATARQRFAEQSEAVRHQRGCGDRLIQAKHGEQHDGGRDRRAGGGEREVDERGEHHSPAPEAIADPARDRLQRSHRDQVRRDDPRGRRDVDPKIAGDLRQRNDDHGRVQRDQQVADRDRDRQPARWHGAILCGAATDERDEHPDLARIRVVGWAELLAQQPLLGARTDDEDRQDDEERAGDEQQIPRR